MIDLAATLVVAAEATPESGQGETGLLIIAGLAAAAFVVGHATRRFVSEVIVFLGIGILVGPNLLGIVDAAAVERLEPVVSIALGAIVFGIGERLELPLLRQIRPTLLPMAVLENVATFGLVFLALILVGADPLVAFLLAAIALSTSPTTLVAVIAGRRARGGFTDHILSLTALNNLTSALVYGLGLPLVLAARSTSGAEAGAIAFAQLLLLSAALGGIGGYVLRRFMHTVHLAGERLLFVLVTLIAVVAASRFLGAPVVISTLVMGTVVANDSRDTSPVFGALRTLEAPIFLVFFLVAGAGVHLDELATVGWVGVAYVIGRTLGKMGGAWVGADLTRSGRRSGWAPWLGGGLFPFAGMAIGLAAFTLEKATEAGLPELGESVSAIVLGSVVVFELIGPVTVGKALDRVGETGKAGGEDLDPDEEQPHIVRHILMPVSSPEMARQKAPQVVDLAASTGAVLTGLHVVGPGERTDPTVGDPALSFVRQVASNRDVKFDPVVRQSESVVDAIVEEASGSAVDLIAIGEPADRPLDEGGGERIVHEVMRRLPANVRVIVVPTTDRPSGRVSLRRGITENAPT